uniref:Ig-like domain-containing protein n=1 Tax=Varanus komodoensis TaxID=61221 RepID=A0A8D2KYH2_VARKO
RGTCGTGNALQPPTSMTHGPPRLAVVNGTWRAAITLPCVYEPSADFKELRVIWKASWDALKTIFHRDANSGDQVLLTTFKGRLSVAKGLPGSVSLLIHQLEMTDTAQYTCEVSWEARNKSLIKRERMTTLKVIKGNLVPASKPIITLSRNASVLPVGSRTSLTCSASGSPTITYKWFKEGPGSIDKLLGRTAVLTLDRLQASDSGSYYCTAENRVSSQRRRSDAVRLTVQGKGLLKGLLCLQELIKVGISAVKGPWDGGRFAGEAI